MMSFLQTDDDIRTTVGKYATATLLSVDIESTGLKWHGGDELRMVSLSVPPFTEGVSFFTTHLEPKTREMLADLLAAEGTRKVGHNIKFDRHMLDLAPGGAWYLGGQVFDTYLLLRGLDENRRERGLNYKLKPVCHGLGLSIDSADKLDDFLTSRGLHKGQMCLTYQELADRVNAGELGPTGHPISIPGPLRPDYMQDAEKKWQVRDASNVNRTLVPVMLLGAYASEDACLTGRLFMYLVEQYKKEGIPWSFAEFKADTLDTAYQMEKQGIPVDLYFLEDYKARLQLEGTKILSQMYPYLQRPGLPFTPESFNPASLDHLTALVENHGFTAKLFTGTGRTQLNKEALEEWNTELGNLLLAYRRVQSVLHTFVEGLLERAVRWPGLDIGVIHTDYNVGEARTGRWSSSNPNMQNVDKKSEARKAFKVPAGYTLTLLDFSQIEPRVTAVESGDENLLKAFREGWDYHTFNASLMLNKPYAEVTKEERAFCKAPGLAKGYGAGANKLAKMLGKTVREAQAFMKEYENRLPAVKRLARDTQAAIEASAWRACIEEGLGSYEGDDYEEGVKLFDGKPIPYRFQPKRPGLPVLLHGAQPQRFAWRDKWNDPDYWAFLDYGGTAPKKDESFKQLSPCAPGFGWYEQAGLKWGGLPQYGYIESRVFGCRWRFRPRNARLGMNTRIQGTAGLLLEAAIYRIKAKYGYIPVLQVHDEIGFFFPTGMWETRALQCKRVMEGMTDLLPGVPIVVDVAATTTTWYDEKDYKEVNGALEAK